ncbi:MAG: hypothetical protein ACK5V3_03520 [Bdellovibrionales bacterium]
MLNKVIMGLLPVLFSLSAMGQRPVYIEEQVEKLAFEIRREGRYLTDQQRQQIARHLESIERVLRGGDSQQPVAEEYTCVSRDNDNRSPYVFAIREGIQVVRLTGETFSSIAECQSTLATAREISGRYFFCASRDNDGRSPYQLAALNGSQITKIQRTTTSAKSECQTLV